MADVYENARRIYTSVTKMNDEAEEYEEEMGNAVEKLKQEEVQRKKHYQARKTTKMKLRSQGDIKDDE